MDKKTSEEEHRRKWDTLFAPDIAQEISEDETSDEGLFFISLLCKTAFRQFKAMYYTNKRTEDENKKLQKTVKEKDKKIELSNNEIVRLHNKIEDQRKKIQELERLQKNSKPQKRLSSEDKNDEKKKIKTDISVENLNVKGINIPETVECEIKTEINNSTTNPEIVEMDGVNFFSIKDEHQTITEEKILVPETADMGGFIPETVENEGNEFEFDSDDVFAELSNTSISEEDKHNEAAVFIDDSLESIDITRVKSPVYGRKSRRISQSPKSKLVRQSPNKLLSPSKNNSLTTMSETKIETPSKSCSDVKITPKKSNKENIKSLLLQSTVNNEFKSPPSKSTKSNNDVQGEINISNKINTNKKSLKQTTITEKCTTTNKKINSTGLTNINEDETTIDFSNKKSKKSLKQTTIPATFFNNKSKKPPSPTINELDIALEVSRKTAEEEEIRRHIINNSFEDIPTSVESNVTYFAGAAEMFDDSIHEEARSFYDQITINTPEKKPVNEESKLVKDVTPKKNDLINKVSATVTNPPVEKQSIVSKKQSKTAPLPIGTPEREYLKDYDKVPSKEKPNPGYVYEAERTRKKAEREQLPGWECHECKPFIDKECKNLDTQEKAEFMKHCSKHRKNVPYISNTPPGIWNMELLETPQNQTQVCESLGTKRSKLKLGPRAIDLAVEVPHSIDTDDM